MRRIAAICGSLLFLLIVWSFFLSIWAATASAHSGGEVSHTVKIKAGSFAPSSFGRMVPDSNIDTAFFVGDSGTIQSFKLDQFSLITSITIPTFAGSPLRIIRWGNNGLAINTLGGPVYLIGGNFVH
jgi:hypothetical protein